ncbi:MAG: hypothetical protein V3T64_16190 [Myxococcota bacterium]
MSDQDERIKTLARDAAEKWFSDCMESPVKDDMDELTSRFADAIRTAPVGKPTAQQAAWVIEQFMEHRDCSFSRKIEIMYPEDGGALNALFRAGGQGLSNALIESED